jgi:hypothetical protein
MENQDQQTSFSKAILTGVFLGIASTLVCLVFAVIYRSITGFYLFSIINFPAIIFGCNVLLATCGTVYFFFRKFPKRGDVLFIAVFILFALFCIWKIQYGQRSADPVLSAQFRPLMSGIVIILCTASIMIPVLFGNKKFLDIFI